MKSLKAVLLGTVVVAGLGVALPSTVAAQSAKAAGVVTTLQGTATVARVSTTQPGPQLTPLKFRDNVFEQDRITTGDQSIARILLGGKAVVTVREHSSLVISETATSSTIEIAAGKIALAVAKDRMRPGESIEVKTPNAVAGVRGTVLIAEVTQATAQAGGTPPSSVTSRFTLLSGLVDVTLLNPAGRPSATRFTMNPLQTLGVTGFTPPPGGPRNITRAQAQAAASDYRVNLKDAPQGTNAQISDRQVEAASNAAAASAGTTGAGSGGGQIIKQLSTPPPPSTPVDVTSNTGTSAGTSSTVTISTMTNTGTTDCPGICEPSRVRRRR